MCLTARTARLGSFCSLSVRELDIAESESVGYSRVRAGQRPHHEEVRWCGLGEAGERDS